jgi:hypothetical protein
MNCIIDKLPHEGFNIGSIIVVPPFCYSVRGFTDTYAAPTGHKNG